MSVKNDPELAARLVDFGRTLTREQRILLLGLGHGMEIPPEETEWCCAAHSEGLWCCLDVIADPEHALAILAEESQ